MTVVWHSAPLPGSGKDKKGVGKDAGRGEAPAPCPTPTPPGNWLWLHSGDGGGVGVPGFSGISFMPWKLARAVRGSRERPGWWQGGVSDISLRPGQDQTSKAQAGAWVDGAWQASSRCVQLFLPVPMQRGLDLETSASRSVGLRHLGLGLRGFASSCLHPQPQLSTDGDPHLLSASPLSTAP